MSAIRIRVWRLGWARGAFGAIVGWRHLFWRLWWRLPEMRPLPRTIDERLPLAPPPILHLVVEPEHRPLCGVSIREPWTIELEAATCPACRHEGERLYLEWWVSTR